MKTITYSLRNDESNSDSYYKDVADFTNIVLKESETQLESIAEEFQFYLIKSKGEILRRKSEYVFELLTLGALLRIYERNALSLPVLPQRILTTLAELRRRFAWVKPFADSVRGILSTIFLTRKNSFVFSNSKFGVDKIEKLIEWLAAAGDFKQDVIRLSVWKDYFNQIPEEKVINYIFASIRFAKWFEKQSVKALGKYTLGVENFLEYKHEEYKWREDLIFCGRQRVEYHLNMVGAEIMNRAWRDEFLSTKKKAVLVPSCMSIKTRFHCKSFFNGIDYSCKRCTINCRVNQLTKLGEQDGFNVFMIPHSTDFSKWLKKRAGNKEVGIVGVTCALNLMTGGWEAKGLDIPINCILLDYCGCKNHWDEKGFPTAINLNELKTVLNIKEKLDLKEEAVTTN
ncbi:MAG: DUF116 domain-containing protein [Ignavibacteriales bacterium]|nr:DUF116 domain-containing protein [Ignavibacteriales bacterium]